MLAYAFVSFRSFVRLFVHSLVRLFVRSPLTLFALLYVDFMALSLLYVACRFIFLWQRRYRISFI